MAGSVLIGVGRPSDDVMVALGVGDVDWFGLAEAMMSWKCSVSVLIGVGRLGQ